MLNTSQRLTEETPDVSVKIDIVYVYKTVKVMLPFFLFATFWIQRTRHQCGDEAVQQADGLRLISGASGVITTQTQAMFIVLFWFFATHIVNIELVLTLHTEF